jgi:hypothetical protein
MDLYFLSTNFFKLVNMSCSFFCFNVLMQEVNRPIYIDTWKEWHKLEVKLLSGEWEQKGAVGKDLLKCWTDALH